MSWELLVPVAFVVLVFWMMVRQRAVYRRYETAQQQVLTRQAEAMALQRESLEVQKEMVRLLGALVDPERRA